MKSFLLRVCVAGFIASLISGCNDRQSGRDETAAEAAAEAWLTTVDQGHYLESWKAADPFFQKAVTTNEWAGAMKKFREPLGKLLSRRLISVESTTQLPNAPAGEYVVMQFRTSFENKTSAIETVTTGPKEGDQWKVSGYYTK